MRRILAAIAALTLSLPVLAHAEEQRDGRESRGGQRNEAPAQQHQAPAPQNHAGPRAGGFFGRADPNAARQERGRGAPDAARVAPHQRGERLVENRDRNRDFRNDRPNDRRDFFNDRDRGRFFDFRGRQYAAMRGPAFHYPRGWGYRHWNRGEFLPSVFLAAPFYFDYDWLGLPPPPPGARWVRNGPDALLVNVYNDRILDVIYDAFY